MLNNDYCTKAFSLLKKSRQDLFEVFEQNQSYQIQEEETGDKNESFKKNEGQIIPKLNMLDSKIKIIEDSFTLVDISKIYTQDLQIQILQKSVFKDTHNNSISGMVKRPKKKNDGGRKGYYENELEDNSLEMDD